MKYTILGFSQEKLVLHGLDLIDAAILRELHDFKATGRMVEKTIDGKRMFWVKYKALIDALPVLGMKTKDSIYRRMMKMVGAGILGHKHVTEGGSFSFFCFTDLSDEMQYLSDEKPTPTDEKPEGYGLKTVGGTDEKPEHNTSLTKDSSNKDTIEARNRKNPDHERDLFESCWKAFGRYGRKIKAWEYWRKLTSDQRLEIADAIPAYLACIDAGRRKKCFEGWINPKEGYWQMDWKQVLSEWTKDDRKREAPSRTKRKGLVIV